ncbi:efflux RND transporter periplasmic adaptor subunit [Rhodanobacter sp. DHB23]|uniref:efflux RND transporter periplasmic adaptor subunit n=1 Tax=Rhodanobacter sp. DHB23 TaxID=2775923 RepID=UPI001782F7CB|nr:efflux RND transporter periplasmic adaptor subunit [Rhodanobacter sp. DHB23]MBD8873618.1 efflux RND transporter periplasmic adaptor subunit [Rhodanobacter sp. DHB23]
MNKPAPPFPASTRHGVAFVLLLATAALGACSSGTDAPESAATTPHNVSLTQAQQQGIHLYTVEPSSYQTVVNTSGVVDFDHNRSTDVLAPISGPVAKLLVALGQTVKQGEALALVDSPDFAAAIDTYRKNLAAARAADQIAATDRDLYAHQAVSQREYAQAQSDAAGADSDRDAALQALVGLHVDAKTIADIQAGRPVSGGAGVIRAPIAGTVVAKSITPGQLLAAGSTDCFTIADTSKMWVMAQLFDREFGAVKVGDAAEVATGDGGRPVAGKVGNVGAVIDPNTRSVTARVAVDNPDGALKQQMYVSVRIRSHDARTGILVPVSAVLRDDENLPFVYVVAQDGSYARTPVTLGERIDDRYLIPQGLHAGDKVVVDGAIFLNFIQTQ